MTKRWKKLIREKLVGKEMSPEAETLTIMFLVGAFLIGTIVTIIVLISKYAY